MISVLFSSLGFVLTKITVEYFSPFSLGFLRYFVAATALIIVAVVFKIKIPDKSDFKWFLPSGAFGFFLSSIAFNKGYETVSASAGTLVLATVPIITAILARFIFNEKIKIFQYLAIILEFAGVIIITAANKESTVDIGLIWIFFGAISFSLYNILQRKLIKKYSPSQTTIYSIFAGGLLLCVFLPGSINEIKNAPRIQFVYILILGIFSSAISFFTWSKAISKSKKMSTVSNYAFLTPVVTSVFGFIMINEKPSKETIISGIIILTGMFIYNFGEKIKFRLTP
jgi:drug/metabolite transporter (DMT)-like permease